MYGEYFLLRTDHLLCVHKNSGGAAVPQEMVEHLAEVQIFKSWWDLYRYLEENMTFDELYAFRIEGNDCRWLVEDRVYRRSYMH